MTQCIDSGRWQHKLALFNGHESDWLVLSLDALAYAVGKTDLVQFCK